MLLQQMLLWLLVLTVGLLGAVGALAAHHMVASTLLFFIGPHALCQSTLQIIICIHGGLLTLLGGLQISSYMKKPRSVSGFM